MRKLVRSLDALDAAEPFEVCIIGSGPAGTVLGTTLAERGIRTVLLESGNSLLDWFADARLRGLAEYEYSGDANYPLTRTTARVVGGNSNFWTGRCERYDPSDFESHPYTPANNPWPIGYAALEPYYTRAERTLRVRGGPLSRYAPPRSEPLPLPAWPNIASLKELMARADLVLDDSPTATPSKGLRFFRVNKEILPRFLRSRHGTLVSGITVTHLATDAAGRIVGAEAATLDGVRKVVRARCYVVACGGIQTPRLLLLSRSTRFPRGIGNDHDRVGRGFNEHPLPGFFGTLRHGRHTLDPRHKIGRTRQFFQSFRAEGLGAVLPAATQSWVFPNHLLHYRAGELPRYVARFVRRIVRPSLFMSALVEMRPHDENRVTLSETRKDAFGNPLAHLTLNFSGEDRRLFARARELLRTCMTAAGATDLEEIELTYGRHHVGACRMGSDPRTSVVDPDLRVHGTPNLYLCGCETFVTGSAVPPVLTITAFAHRLGDHLEQLLRQRHRSLIDTASEPSGVAESTP